MTTHWKPGETIVMRGLWREKIWWALPATVVRDEPELIALYWPAGTPNKHTAGRVAPLDLLTVDSPTLIDSHWTNTDVLMLIPPTASHAVYVMWAAGHTRFNCWYINLQSPMCRTSVGCDVEDYMLDIVIEPDLHQWHWKDEDEFEEAVLIGVYSHQKAQAIRAEGEAVLRQMEDGAPPFCDGWETWTPPGNWTVPSFPDNWDKLD